MFLSALYETFVAVLVHLLMFAGVVCAAVGIWAVYANHRCRVEEQESAEHFAVTEAIRVELEEAEEKPYRVIDRSRRGPERVV